MFEKEKRKGLPTRGVLYLMAGIVIGVAGMALVMMISTRAVPRKPQATSFPVIPTPDIRHTGTAAAQTVPQTTVTNDQLLAFAVDEKHDQIVISYHNGQENAVELRFWTDSKVSSELIALFNYGQTVYTELSLNTLSDPSTLTMSSPDNPIIRILSTDLSSDVTQDTRVMNSFSSPDKVWTAIISDNQTVKINRIPFASFSDLTITGLATSVAFSPDSQRMIVTSLNNGKILMSVFPLPPLTTMDAFNNLAPVRTYTFEGAISSPIVFSPDNIHIALGIESSVRVLSLEDDEQRYFETVKPVQQLAIDHTGKWLAVVGGETDPGGDQLITFYDLEESATIPPTLTMTQTIRMNDDVIGLQFVEEGLLVGEGWGNITLYRWTGEFWGDPVIVMENFK